MIAYINVLSIIKVCNEEQISMQGWKSGCMQMRPDKKDHTCNDCVHQRLLIIKVHREGQTNAQGEMSCCVQMRPEEKEWKEWWVCSLWEQAREEVPQMPPLETDLPPRVYSGQSIPGFEQAFQQEASMSPGQQYSVKSQGQQYGGQGRQHIEGDCRCGRCDGRCMCRLQRRRGG